MSPDQHAKRAARVGRSIYEDAYRAGRRQGLKEAAEAARFFPAAGKFVDGLFVAGPNTPYAIANAIEALAEKPD